MLSPTFIKKLDQVSERLGMNPRDLLLVMYMESGVSAGAINPHGNATGLIQFMPQTLKGLGLSKDQIKNFHNTSAEDQLDLVEKYIKGKGRQFKSATEYYVANFFPASLSRWTGSSPIENRNVVVAARDAKNPNERAAYEGNQVLDANKDGKITVGDLMKVLSNVGNSSGYKAMLDQLNEQVGEGVPSDIPIRHRNKHTMKSIHKQPEVEMTAPENQLSSYTPDSTVNTFLKNLEQYFNIAAEEYKSEQMCKVASLQEECNIYNQLGTGNLLSKILQG